MSDKPLVVDKSTIVRLVPIAYQPTMEKRAPDGMPMMDSLLSVVFKANLGVEALTVTEVPDQFIARDGAAGAMRFADNPDVFLYWTEYER